jgi:DNA-binding SARP family transcriptional activator
MFGSPCAIRLALQDFTGAKRRLSAAKDRLTPDGLSAVWVGARTSGVLEFRVLGPLEVLSDGHALELGGRRQRALLALLLLGANRPVSRERLIDALWEDEPTATANKALHVYVSQLRKLMGSERLQTKAPGYLLRVEDGELDLERFKHLHAEDRHEEALSLWRGTALADLSDQRFAQLEAGRLDEMRLTCLEDRLDDDLAAGRDAELVAELDGLVKEYPLRQRLRAQLMLALYRSGRDAEALEAYQDARSMLVEELGIEPRRELRDLHRAILRQDPLLEPSRGETLPDSSRHLFVGRERELEQLLAGLDGAFVGRGCLILLVGEPGIGKSWLIDELAGRARARGAHVVSGRCWEAGGAPAYWPWLQSLRSYCRESDPGVLRGQLGAGAADVAQLLPELREVFPDLPDPPVLEAESARFRLFDAVASFVGRAAADRPLVLALDDLHAADESSLLLLRFLARELVDSRVLVLGAYRDVDPTIRDPLAAAIAELVREPVTQRVELAGLPEPNIAEYIERTTKLAPERTLVAQIHAETEGNPLFVAELTRLLLREGTLEAPLGRGRIPQSVRAVIGRRLRRLSADAQRTLSIASVLGREFPLDVLERLVGVASGELLDLLDEAVASRIVTDVAEAPDRLRFAHVLIRDTLYDELTPARRLRLHQSTGETIEQLYAEQLEPHLSELAHHFAEAAPIAETDKALNYARCAVDHAAKLLAFEEAARLYRLALSLTDAQDPAARSHRCELLVSLGDVETRTGDMPSARETFLHASEIATEINSAELLARAALGYGGRFVWTGRDAHQLVPLLERAAQALGEVESPLRVRVLARLANAISQHRPEQSDVLSAEALSLARRLRDPTTLPTRFRAACSRRGHRPTSTSAGN